MAVFPDTKAKCKFCGKEFSNADMPTHIAMCDKRKSRPVQGTTSPGAYDILVSSADYPSYWMILNVPAKAELVDLDEILRKIWFDPADYLSEFEIGMRRYVATPFGNAPAGMNSMQIGVDCLQARKRGVRYVFDMGLASHVDLQVIGLRNEADEKGISVLARNDVPSFVCSRCKERRAKWIHDNELHKGPSGAICTPCATEEMESWYKDEYGDEEEYEDEYEDEEEELDIAVRLEENGFEPLSNSPRVWDAPCDLDYNDILGLPDEL